MTRGLSQAAIKAAEHARKHPDIKAPDLAKKFGLNLSTVYRSDWWKNRRSGVAK